MLDRVVLLLLPQSLTNFVRENLQALLLLLLLNQEHPHVRFGRTPRYARRVLLHHFLLAKIYHQTRLLNLIHQVYVLELQ